MVKLTREQMFEYIRQQKLQEAERRKRILASMDKISMGNIKMNDQMTKSGGDVSKLLFG